MAFMTVYYNYPPMCRLLRHIQLKDRDQSDPLRYGLHYGEGATALVFNLNDSVFALKVYDDFILLHDSDNNLVRLSSQQGKQRQQHKQQQQKQQEKEVSKLTWDEILNLDELNYNNMQVRSVDPAENRAVWTGYVGLLLNHLKLPYFLKTLGVFRCNRSQGHIDVVLSEYLIMRPLRKFERSPEAQQPLTMETILFKTLYALNAAFKKYGLYHADLPKNIYLIQNPHPKTKFKVYNQTFILPKKYIEPIIIDYDACELYTEESVAFSQVMKIIKSTLNQYSPLFQTEALRNPAGLDFKTLFTSDLFSVFKV